MKFETIEAYSLPERIEAIAKYLVSILSVNGTAGEVKLADAIFRDFFVFDRIPIFVVVVNLAN